MHSIEMNFIKLFIISSPSNRNSSMNIATAVAEAITGISRHHYEALKSKRFVAHDIGA